ncbi:MAG: sugar phosphate isomerase/epimerase [Clostridia bacterium]|nr:sugar phosphate isomerase/epimerase [Clostridia bacterium]
MLLSSSHSQFARKMSTEAAIDLMANAGFDAIDFSFHISEEYYGEQTDGELGRTKFIEWRKRAEDRGLVFNQAHAPEGSSFRDMNMTVRRFHDIRRAIRNASYLGVPIVVVHPVQHLQYCLDGVPEQLFEWNMQFYNALKPYCEEYGVKVAVENMWQQPGALKIDHSTCSRPEEFVRYVDTLNSEWFVACVDIGHAPLVGVDPCELIRALGKDRLKALHVHDVDGKEDLHTLPYFSKINWDSVCAALREIGYEGDLTFEAGNFVNPLPRELCLPAANMMVATGRYLIGKIKI